MFCHTTVNCVVYSDLKKLFWLEHFRALIFDNFRGLSREECIDELKSLFGDEAASYTTMKN